MADQPDALESPFTLDEGNPVAEPIDPTVQLALNQGFAERHNVLGQVATQIASGNRFVQEAAQHQYLQSAQLLGATAAQVLMGNKLAQDILAQRSAGMQPQAAGGPQPHPAT